MAERSCDGILYGKMADWKNAEAKGLFPLRLVLFLYSEKNMGLKPVWKCIQVQQQVVVSNQPNW